MKKIFTILLKHKLSLLIAFVILVVAEIFLTWKKYDGISLYQSMMIFVKFAIEIIFIGVVVSIFIVLKEKRKG